MNSNNLDKAIENVLEFEKKSDENDVRNAVASQQKEFPYQRDEEAQVTRREFCNFLVLTSTALFVGAAGFSGKAFYDSRTQPKFPQLKIEGANEMSAGSALNFRYPTEKDTAILIRSANGKYHAYGQKCTHLSCPVYYEKKTDRIECPCHEAGFEVATGNVLYGPPPRPLDKIAVEVRGGGEVWAVGREAGGHES